MIPGGENWYVTEIGQLRQQSTCPQHNYTHYRPGLSRNSNSVLQQNNRPPFMSQQLHNQPSHYGQVLVQQPPPSQQQSHYTHSSSNQNQQVSVNQQAPSLQPSGSSYVLNWNAQLGNRDIDHNVPEPTTPWFSFSAPGSSSNESTFSGIIR